MHLHACIKPCLFDAFREGGFSTNHLPDHWNCPVWLQIGKSSVLKLHRCSHLLTYYNGLIWHLVVISVRAAYTVAAAPINHYNSDQVFHPNLCHTPTKSPNKPQKNLGLRPILVQQWVTGFLYSRMNLKSCRLLSKNKFFASNDVCGRWSAATAGCVINGIHRDYAWVNGGGLLNICTDQGETPTHPHTRARARTQIILHPLQSSHNKVDASKLDQ